MLGIAFAGFRHGHIFALYNAAKNHPLLQITGGWEENEQAKKQAEQTTGIQRFYETYEELLADPTVDIVAVGDYYGIRGERILQALRAGKHIITDKPLCTSLEEAEQICTLAEQMNRKVEIMLDLRYYDVVQEAKKIIAEGALGEINNIAFCGHHPLCYGSRASWYFEKGKHGGTFNDIGIHGMDLVYYLTGKRVEKVLAARCWNAFAKEVPYFEDSAQAMCQLEGGAGLLADVSYAAPDTHGYSMPTYWEFHISGTEGAMIFGVNLPQISLYRKGEKQAELITPKEHRLSMLDDFIKEIVEGKAEVLPSAEALASAIETLRIQKAADRN